MSEARRLHVAILAANTFEFDSRLLRAASALAHDGHRVSVLALWADGLPDRDQLPDGVDLRRVRLERRQPPRTLNQRLNLANKLFESLMAGVPVVVANGTEHCRLVSRDATGICCNVDAPPALAAAIASLLAAPAHERLALRARCRTLALERYSWERQSAGLVGLYRRLASEATR